MQYTLDITLILLVCIAISLQLSSQKEREKKLRDEIAFQRAKLQQFDQFLEFVKGAPVSSGVCCCGSEVDKHGYSDGHSAVDQWDYSLGKWVEVLERS